MFSKVTKKVVFAGLACLGALMGGVDAIYEQDAGKNDWYRQLLGEVNDAILLPEQMQFMLSSTGLLSMYNQPKLRSQWRIQLPNHETESYKLRHFGWAYLMAHSDERVVLLNGYGDVTLE